jgi:membrane protein
MGTLTLRELARNVWKEMNEDDVFSVAAQLAYYFIFALFPLLLFLVTLIGFLPVESHFSDIIGFLQGVLPQEALTMIQGNIEVIVREQRGGLLSIGLIVTLWAASRGVIAIMSGLNQAYDVKESRPWWKLQVIALALTVSLSIFVIVASILMIFGGQIGAWLANLVGLGPLFQIAWPFIRWFLSSVIMMGVVAVLYYFGPDVEQEWKWVTPGAIIAVFGWITASLAFSYYVNHFGAYNKTYGAIGTMIILLTWMYLTGVMILLGGEINAEIERSLPEGKSAGEKRIAHKHPWNFFLKARAQAPVKGKARSWLFSPWSIVSALAASGGIFYFIRRHRSRSSET